MTAIKKFMFDLDFGTDEPDEKLEVQVESEHIEVEQEQEEEILPEEEIVPTFSEEQLQAAKQESYESGLQDGTQKASETIERETLTAIRSLSQNITEIFAIQEQANNRMVSDGVGIASTIIRKLFPDLNERNGVQEIDRLIETTLLRLLEEPRVVVRVNSSLIEAVGNRVEGLKAGAGYEGRIILKSDDKMDHGDCRLEWGDGSAERNSAALWDSIDSILREHIGDMTLSPYPPVSHAATNPTDSVESPDQAAGNSENSESAQKPPEQPRPEDNSTPPKGAETVTLDENASEDIALSVDEDIVSSNSQSQAPDNLDESSESPEEEHPLKPLEGE